MTSQAVLDHLAVKRATHSQFREQKVKIGMGLILRLELVKDIQSIVNGLYLIEFPQLF